MTVGDEDHCRVAMTVAVGLGGFRQALNLVVGEILARADIGVFWPDRHRNCSFYDG